MIDIVRNWAIGGVGLVLALNLSGCVAVLQTWNQRAAVPVIEQETDTPEGKRLVVSPAKAADAFWPGYLLDAAVAGNVVRLIVTFGSETDALIGTALGAALTPLLDGAAAELLHLGRPRPAAVTLGSSAGDLSVRVPLVVREGRYEALIPADLFRNDQPMQAAIVDAGGNLLTKATLRPFRMARGPEPSAAPSHVSVDVDEPLAYQVAPDPDAVALVIGVERYSNEVPPVMYAVRDARAIARHLRDVLGVDSGNVITLLDEQATSTNIRVAVERKLANRVVAGRSTVYVYFAGHGVADPKDRVPYLVPFDGDPKFPHDTCYATAGLYQAIGRLKARRALVMLDACFTGVASREPQPTALMPTVRPLMVVPIVPAVPSGVTVLAASGADEMSAAAPDKQHGLFTYFLLKALRGETAARRDFSLRDVFTYVRENVQKGARRQDREQTPVLMGADAAEWKLGR